MADELTSGIDPASPAPEPSADAITVLVVDDERSNLESLDKIFARVFPGKGRRRPEVKRALVQSTGKKKRKTLH